jgi:hypothetical protein
MMKAVSATRSKDRRVGVGRVYLNQNGADSWKPVIALISEDTDLSTLDVAFEDVNGICVDKPQ